MKKFITLALALVMVLGLAAPALAYTTNVAPAQGVSPYTVRIYMVEYANVDIFSGWITMPPSDRGYATNEVVAFVGELTVPAKRIAWDDYYRALQFKTKNVTLNVTDNYGAVIKPSNSPDPAKLGFWLRNTMPTSAQGWEDKANQGYDWEKNGDSNKLTAIFRPATMAANAGTRLIPQADSQKVYKWLGFGKVTGDDATVTFTLSRNAKFTPINNNTILLWNTLYTNTSGGIIPASAQHYDRTPITFYDEFLELSEKYLVFKAKIAGVSGDDGPFSYYVYENVTQSFGVATVSTDSKLATPATSCLGELLFKIETKDIRGKTDRMWIFPKGVAGPSYRVHVEPSIAYLDIIVNGETGSVNLNGNKKIGDQVPPDSATYKSAVDFYNQYVVEAFGFDAWNRGNLLTDSDWQKIAAAAWDISDTVDVEPWTPYVAVPENIVTDPPKTGDASVLGFVMIVLAAAAAVVVKKVRA